uniref:Uncharacterized protein n=1 Tax=Schistocephalus solidus TaxID=70667 RepID=A0A0V0J853_SCHSO
MASTSSHSENLSEIVSSSLSDGCDYAGSRKPEDVGANAFADGICYLALCQRSIGKRIMSYISLCDRLNLMVVFPQCQIFSARDIVLSDEIREFTTSMLKCFSKLNIKTLRLDQFGPNLLGGAITCLIRTTIINPLAFSHLTLLDLSQQFQPLSLLLRLFSSADSVQTVSRFPHLKFLVLRPIRDNHGNPKQQMSSSSYYSSSSLLSSDEFRTVPLPCLSSCILHLSFDVFSDSRKFRSLMCVIQMAEALTISQRFCSRKLGTKAFRTDADDWSFSNLRYLQIPPWDKLIQALATGRREAPSRFPLLQRVCIQLCDQLVHIHPLSRLSQLLPDIKISLTGFGQTCLEAAAKQGEEGSAETHYALLLGSDSIVCWPHILIDHITSLEIAVCPETMDQTLECRLSQPLAQVLQVNFGKLEKLTFSTLFRDEKPDSYAAFSEVISRLSRFCSLHLLPLLACGGDRLESLTLSTEIWIASGIEGELEMTLDGCFNSLPSVKSLSLLRFARNKYRSLAFPAELQYPFAKELVYARGLERLCGLFPNLQSLTLHTEPSFCLSVLQPLATLCPRLSRLSIFHLAVTGPYMMEPLKALLSTLPLELLLLHVSSLSIYDYAALEDALTSRTLRYVFLYACEGERLSTGELRNMALAMPSIRWLLIYVESQKTCFTAHGTSGVNGLADDQLTLTEEYCESFEYLFTSFPQLYGVFWEEELRGRCRYPYWLPEYTEEIGFEGRVCNLNKI